MENGNYINGKLLNYATSNIQKTKPDFRFSEAIH